MIRLISTTFLVLIAFLYFIPTSNVYARPIEVGISAFDVSGKLPDKKTIAAFEKKLGRSLNSINFFLGFNPDHQEFPAFPLKEAKEIPPRIMLMFTLEPWGDNRDNAGNIIDPFGKLNEGKADQYLLSLALAMKKYGRPIRVRFGHEMIQGDNPQMTAHRWYPWQDCPDSYIKAYKRVYRIFKNALHEKVQFVWSPNFEPYYLDVLEKYYPGPRFVDWIGIDGYNWGGGDFDSVFRKIYFNLTRHPEIFGRKPIMLSEIAAAQQPQSKNFNKALWIKDAFMKIDSAYPRVASFYWFNVNKERDWRLDENSESWQAFKIAVSKLNNPSDKT